MNLDLTLFGLQPAEYVVERIGSGHINHTYKVIGKKKFILQRVNKDVFKNPEIIATNLRAASDYLKEYYPEYPFMTSIRSAAGKEMEYDAEGFPWRLFPYSENTMTIDKVSSPEEAFSAAAEFGMLTKYLDQVNVSSFKETIPRFHDLEYRKEQFEEALGQAGKLSNEASDCVATCKKFYHLVQQYNALIKSKALRLRIVHNDTKINNVLFERGNSNTVGVIDLDTLMPGYFIYDLGDMVRTFVCPVSEEEGDLTKIAFRGEVYRALLDGYLSEMKEVLSREERASIPFAGKMMTYIMALRFLADYLRGNTYYQVKYSEQNLVRASNQLKLLEVISKNLPG